MAWNVKKIQSPNLVENTSSDTLLFSAMLAEHEFLKHICSLNASLRIFCLVYRMLNENFVCIDVGHCSKFVSVIIPNRENFCRDSP